MQPDIWQDDEPTWLATVSRRERADPLYLTVVVARGRRAVVCAAWVRVRAGNGLRDVLGWRTCAGLARARGLPGMVSYLGKPGRERGFRFIEVAASINQPPDP